MSIAKRIGKASKSIRELAADLETGTVKPAVKDARRDVRAAELRDLHGMPYEEIARELGMGEPGKRDKTKGGHQPTENAVKRGRAILDKALGGEGRWLEYAAEHRRKARPTI